MSDPTFRGPDERDAERPRTNDERDAAAGTAAGTATGAAAGAVAGVAAGLGTIAAGPLGAIFGAFAGAAIGAAGGVGTEESIYTSEHEDHYRALWEATPGRAADASFDTARPAYQLGHVAASRPEYAGRDFHDVEGDLRRIWERDFAARHGSWEAARHYVCDGYGHARGEGFGVRRDTSVIGTGGSAVDPVELARARAGLASRADTPEGDEPLFPTDLGATTGTAADAPTAGRLGERDEVPANRTHPERTDFI
ncbi:hypothetical protein J421_4353 [Gemmatirosa kalamazoonensis]|uniref:Glycine zipper domain-containing protein n=1 Tax=Gemmatirosa kalamazoonensis TaxID=861299 RepID=W0RNI4_9BACT|nr:hypothetical protein [Gemmatirosa kalamazoonensis]AHG91890.1 hypothetical protein J421_4353 [Gemmatirosa kalamazoonensis]